MNIYTNNSSDKSPVGIFYTDHKGDWSYVNERWCELTGLSSHDANNSAWLAAVHPDDRERCKKEWLAAFHHHETYSSEHRYLHPNGKIVWVLAQAFPARGQKKELRDYIGAIIDITHRKETEVSLRTSKKQLEGRITKNTHDLKRINISLKKEIHKQKCLANALSASEARWRSVVENVPNFILTTNRAGKILFINRVWPEFAQKTVVGSSLYHFLPKDSHKMIKQAMKLTFDTGKPTRYITKGTGVNNTTIWYSSRIGPIRQNDEIVAAIIISTDITERVTLQEQIEQHRRELTHFSQINSMEEVASSIAHELNQPLGAISNYAKACSRRLQKNSLTNEDLRKFSERIASQATRAGEIIQRIRNMIRRTEPNRARFQINAVIQEAVNFLDTEKKGHSLNILFKQKNNLPDVIIDKLQIEQVIINIVQNGIESIRESAVNNGCVTITADISENHFIRVYIADNGRGLPKEETRNIFDPFFSTKRQGIGIGLAICRSVIEAHGGKIVAKNNTKKGASFSFTLPCSIAHTTIS